VIESYDQNMMILEECREERDVLREKLEKANDNFSKCFADVWSLNEKLRVAVEALKFYSTCADAIDTENASIALVALEKIK
jgi:hypothetical protein